MTPEAVADRLERARDPRVTAALRHAAFEEISRSFQAMAVASAARLLDDADEARDATQDALLAAWLKLSQLRTPAAFAGWLKRLVATECRRRLRKRPILSHLDDRSIPLAAIVPCDAPWLPRMLATLTEPERQTVVRFYVHGYTLREIAASVGAPPATVGKRLYTARLKVRRALPPSIRESALRARTRRPGSSPDELAEYVGVYRFDKRPELVVEIRRSRRGDFLASYSQGQRDVLHHLGNDTLVTRAFDGEGRFQRDQRGRITRFVYYEFGVRLGVAKRVRSPQAVAGSGIGSRR
jgi:RNA polymerase sigma-70 factor (ECF subfamily)